MIARALQPEGRETIARRFVTWLKPLDAAAQEIRALDGLRAIAALLVVGYHTAGAASLSLVVFGANLNFAWIYAQTGVQLFFVLSGFLLFLPYARAMLADTALPSARTFYRRRALRILPAYYVCFGVLLALRGSVISATEGALFASNVGLHILLLHNLFPPFDRTFEAPFWTLTVEWQFYLILPLIAFGISRLAVGRTRSKARLLAGVLGLIVAALGLRLIVAVVNDTVVPTLTAHSALSSAVDWVIWLLTGTEGRYIEVFALGMLGAVLYSTFAERRVSSPRLMLGVSLSLLLTSVVVSFIMARVSHADMGLELAPPDNEVHVYSLWSICGPLIVGLGYATLVLGVLFGSRLLRAPFEFTPLRYIGLWSYSLYLWHGPALAMYLPGTQGLNVVERLLIGLALSYASYQCIERPVMLYRKRSTTTAPVNPPGVTLESATTPAVVGAS